MQSCQGLGLGPAMKSKYLICQAVLRWQLRPRKNNSAYFSVPGFLSSRSYYVLDSNGVRHNLGGWTEPELAILRNTDSSSRISRGVNNKIFNKLQEAGFHRSKWAIASKRRELGLKRVERNTHEGDADYIDRGRPSRSRDCCSK